MVVGNAAKNAQPLSPWPLECHPGLVPGAPYTDPVTEHIT